MHSTSSLLAMQYRFADRLMLPLLWGLFVLALCLAPWYGTWTLAFSLGLPFALVPTILIFALPGARLTRIAVAVAFMLFCALHIHQALGTTELHFGIFVLLAILLCYRDWLVIVVAAGVAAVHHLSFNYLQSLGWNTICFVEPGFGRVLAHELQSMVDRLSGRRDGAIELDMTASVYRSPGARSLSGTLGMVATAVANVRSAAVSMHDSLSRITRSNVEVSQGALRQAEMVQEAVGAVDSIAQAGSHGQQQAAGAVGQAEEVSRMAGQGSTVMQQSVATMVAISESSSRIAEITAVIDGIAFQTNILALNAAVEAARAGPEGRGFSVVAGEVRSLAHRSAEAAKEIRALIEASVGQVEQGRDRIEAAGRVMDQVLEGVSRLTTVLAESRDASESQSRLIADVGRIVRDISSIAHDNVHTLEAVGQSVQRLEQDSTGLVESVRRFSIESDDAEVIEEDNLPRGVTPMLT